jgi:hypothetical protein
MVVKCGGCADAGIDTWFCPDCLEAEDGECGRCEERAVDGSNFFACGVHLPGHHSSGDQQLDRQARADFGREILSHAYHATDTMAT